MDRHGWILQFFIESKLFQLVVEEEENFFSLQIFEQGKYFMQSVFMDKNAAHWLMHSLEHIVIGVNPKHFFTLREGDVAYTLQRGSNSFGPIFISDRAQSRRDEEIYHYSYKQGTTRLEGHGIE